MSSPIFLVRTITGSVEAVFAAWVSPATVVDPVTAVAMQPEFGGHIRLSTGGDPDDDLAGRFLIVDRPRRLRYTWRWGTSQEETMVNVRFTEIGAHTVVEVDQRGFLDEASRRSHLDGWVTYLDALPSFL